MEAIPSGATAEKRISGDLAMEIGKSYIVDGILTLHRCRLIIPPATKLRAPTGITLSVCPWKNLVWMISTICIGLSCSCAPHIYFSFI